MYQYFVKVVPTTYTEVNGLTTRTNQYSITKHEKQVSILSLSGEQGLPGIFVLYELSPLMVKFTEKHRYGVVSMYPLFCQIVNQHTGTKCYLDLDSCLTWVTSYCLQAVQWSYFSLFCWYQSYFSFKISTFSYFFVLLCRTHFQNATNCCESVHIACVIINVNNYGEKNAVLYISQFGEPYDLKILNLYPLGQCEIAKCAVSVLLLSYFFYIFCPYFFIRVCWTANVTLLRVTVKLWKLLPFDPVLWMLCLSRIQLQDFCPLY